MNQYTVTGEMHTYVSITVTAADPQDALDRAAGLSPDDWIIDASDDVVITGTEEN